MAQYKALEALLGIPIVVFTIFIVLTLLCGDPISRPLNFLAKGGIWLFYFYLIPINGLLDLFFDYGDNPKDFQTFLGYALALAVCVYTTIYLMQKRY